MDISPEVAHRASIRFLEEALEFLTKHEKNVYSLVILKPIDFDYEKWKEAMRARINVEKSIELLKSIEVA